MEFKNWLIKNITVSATVAVVLLAAIVFLGMDITSRSQSISEKRQELAANLDAIESLASLKVGTGKSAELKSTLERLLPPIDQLIEFSKVLERAARNNRLDFGFAFEEEIAAKETEPGINGFTLALEGSYVDFLRFLSAVEKSNYLVDWEFIELAESGARYNILVRGKVFSQ